MVHIGSTERTVIQTHYTYFYFFVKELQQVPPASVSSNKFQKHFRSTSDSSRLKRELEGHYDIIYVIDSSSSITRAEFRKGIEAIQMLIDRGVPETKHAAMTVASEAKLIFSFTSAENAAQELTKLQKTGGKTNMQEALEKSLNVFRNPWFGSRVGSFKRVLVVTDGQSNIKRNQTLRNAMELKLYGAEIFVVGVGDYLDGIDELAHMASSLDVHLYRAGDMQGFIEIVKLITPVSYRRDWAAEMRRLRKAFIVGRQ